MTVPQVNTDQKNASAVIDNFDDTRSTIGLQSEYNSVISSSHQAAQTMKLAKMIAVTALAMTFVLGIFVLMNTSRVCDCRFGDGANMESRSNPFFEPLTASSDDQTPSTKRLPISIQMEGEAGELMRKNKKGRVNCAVERKVATQIIASEPKLLITPYGNITTDPRIIHMTGEKMIFTCSPGKERGSRKSNKNKKFATVINLNALEKDEKEDKDSTSTVSNDLPILRPKRSAEKMGETKKKKTHLTCDCHCPQDPE